MQQQCESNLGKLNKNQIFLIFFRSHRNFFIPCQRNFTQTKVLFPAKKLYTLKKYVSQMYV